MFDLLQFGDQGWGDELIAGAWVTIQLALASLGFGLLFGLLLAGGKLVKIGPLRWICHGYTLVIRGIPEFLLIMIVFFGMDRILNTLLAGLGSELRVETPPFVAACLALAMIFGAYASEVFRGAFLSVPSGQMEAAASIGMRPSQAFWRVRFPQMWRFAIPGLGNLWMVMVKDTSLAAVIALPELLFIAKQGGESTREPLVFFFAAGLIYLSITIASDYLRFKLEARARRGMAKTS